MRIHTSSPSMVFTFISDDSPMDIIFLYFIKKKQFYTNVTYIKMNENLSNKCHSHWTFSSLRRSHKFKFKYLTHVRTLYIYEYIYSMP